jgi:hypothetical protein
MQFMARIDLNCCKEEVSFVSSLQNGISERMIESFAAECKKMDLVDLTPQDLWRFLSAESLNPLADHFNQLLLRPECYERVVRAGEDLHP